MENLKPLRQSNFSTACIRPEVALLDEVEQGQARGLVLLGDGHHQPEVGLHEGLLGALALEGGPPQLPLLGRGQALRRRRQLRVRLPAGFDGLGQANLVVLGQQRVLADVGQIQPNQIFVVSLEALLCQLHQVLRFPHQRGGRPTLAQRHRRNRCSLIRVWRFRAQRLLLSKFTGRVKPSERQRPVTRASSGAQSSGTDAGQDDQAGAGAGPDHRRSRAAAGTRGRRPRRGAGSPGAAPGARRRASPRSRR